MLQVCCIPKDLTKTEPLGPGLGLIKFSNKTDLDIARQKESFNPYSTSKDRCSL